MDSNYQLCLGIIVDRLFGMKNMYCLLFQGISRQLRNILKKEGTWMLQITGNPAWTPIKQT